MQIAGVEPDIIMVTEVIPKAQVLPLSPALLSVEGYSLFTNFDPSQPNLGRSGYRGLCIYVRDALLCREVIFSTFTSFEHLWISVDLRNNDKLLIGCIYLSPSGNRQQSMLELTEELKFACQSKPSHLLIGGDFNVPQIDWSILFSAEPEGHYSHSLIQCVQDCFLTQHVSSPTRFRPGQPPSLLDLLLTNEEGMIRDLSYQPGLGLSDHIALVFNLACYTVRSVPMVKTLNYNKGDYGLLRRLLSDIDWTRLCNMDVQQAYHFFRSSLQAAVDSSIPKLKPRARKNVYITGKAMKLKRRKAALWSAYMSSKDPIDFARYCTIRNKLRSLTRKLRANFEKLISKELKSNPKVFWKYTNSRLKTKPGIEDLKDEKGFLCSDDHTKAQILNNFFSSVFTNEDTSRVPVLSAYEGSPLENLVFTEDKVKALLDGLNTSSSPGPDGIHPRILKEASSQVAQPLTMLFQKSLNTGILPKEWKLGTVVPIFKKGNRQDPGNYRPVSLTAVPCKILETLIRDCLMTHLMTEGLLHSDQHGFRPRKSCSSQLLEVLQDWSCSVEHGESVDVLYLDFRKAFDAVPHQRLLRKVESYGISGSLKRWIAAFLQDRSQQVVVRGHSSQWTSVSSGVPQGSVLGPVLFIIYINDLPEVVSSSIKIFADDTKIYRNVSPVSGHMELQADLEAVASWSAKWQLPFNVTKCKSLHVGSQNPCHIYRMGDTNLDQALMEKDLGIHIDSELKFRKQAAAAAAKGNQLLALIKRSFMYISVDTLPVLYKTLVRPHLEYGNLIWGPFNRADQKLIERVQRRATRLVPEIKGLPYPERLRRLGLPSLYYRRRRGDMIAMYQVFNGGMDIQPDEFFSLAPSVGTRGHSMKLRKPQAHSRVRRCTFAVRAINDWNGLPPSVILAPSLNQFKAQIDNHWNRLLYTIQD